MPEARAHVCATQCSCAGAELPGPTDSERSCCAINLTSIETIVAKIFVRSDDVAETSCSWAPVAVTCLNIWVVCDALQKGVQENCSLGSTPRPPRISIRRHCAAAPCGGK
jgi:hypothetical protein